MDHKTTEGTGHQVHKMFKQVENLARKCKAGREWCAEDLDRRFLLQRALGMRGLAADVNAWNQEVGSVRKTYGMQGTGPGQAARDDTWPIGTLFV